VARFPKPTFLPAPGVRGAAIYVLELAVVGAAYFGLAKTGLTLAALHSSDIPLWAPAGVALAAVLLRGMRVWPAIFVAAFAAGPPIDVADATAADSILLAAAVAAGNTLEALVGGGLIKVWAHGRSAFETAAGTAKFALVAAGPSAALGAAIGVGSFYFAGYVDAANLPGLAVRWWLRDAAGMLVIAPPVVLWALIDLRAFNLDKALAFGIAVVTATLVGLVAFSPLVEQSANRSALGFLAILPL
jgi:integral membrane sensor domain MASE1